MKQPILVTGGAGFIGSHLVEALVDRGEAVRVLDDLSSGKLQNLESAMATGAVEFARGSVNDRELFTACMDGCTKVFHLAASVGVGMITAQPTECLRNNLEGVQRLFEAVDRQKPAPRVVLFSSSEVYGKSEDVPLREDGDLVLGPSHISRWTYASGKVVGEFLAVSEHRRSGVPVTVVRCFNTCGPRQRATYGMVIPRFLDQGQRGEPLTVYGDGKQTRCFSYVEDVVEQVLRLSDHPDAVGEIFNVGSDEETSILELAERILDLTGRRSVIRAVPYGEVYGAEFQDVKRRVPDLGKLRRLVGAPPATGLDRLLRITLESRLRTQSAPLPAVPSRAGS